MDHAQAAERFSAYSDKELPADEVGALEEHLRGCESCRRDWDEFQRTVSSMHQLVQHPAPIDFSKGVIDRIRQRSGGRFFAPRRAIDRIPYQLFSLLMLGIILVLYLYIQMSHPGRVNIP